jgi:hypothetical protein
MSPLLMFAFTLALVILAGTCAKVCLRLMAEGEQQPVEEHGDAPKRESR